jgi:hypothetical protein
MQSFYPAVFERTMGYTPGEWRLRLPLAIGAHPWTEHGGTAQVELAQGTCVLAWRELTPRSIALMRIPQMQVRFEFSGLSDEERLTFMKRFDLAMQKGGG